MKEDTIKILGARVHNLKNIDLEIPRRKLVVITGLSGSGKSSLAFDTIYAEGQRRYMETLSTYARQFVGTMERPDVDKITGLSPVVAIEQKTTNKNPRSTVGTVTEINDFLRLLYARASRAYSPVTGEEMVHYTDEQIAGLIMTGFTGRKIALMAPIVKGRKGHYRELFESLAKKGYIYARIDGEIREISAGMRLDRYKIHTIDLVVDRLVVGEEARDRVMTSLRESLRQGKGTMAVYDYGTEQQRFYSRHLMCPSTGIAFEDPAPHTFSFNSPQGACPDCNGLGEEAVFDVGKIIPDMGLSLREGAVEPLGKYRNNMLFAILEMLGRRYDFTLDDPVGSLPEPGLNAVLYGDSEPLTINLSEFSSSGGNHLVSVGGRRRIYRPYRRRGLQTRPEMARAVPRLPQMFGLRRFAPQEGGAPVPHRRQEHRRRVGHVDLRIFGMGGAHRGLYGRQGVEDRTGGRQGDPRAPALPDGRRVGLPVAVAFVAFALGRREPAYSPRHADRLEAGQRALYPRRALDRPAPARQPAPDPQPGGVARCRQLGDRRRTRRGHDACRRLHRRRRPPCGAQGRAYHGRGYDRRHPAFRFHHGRLPHRTPPYRDSRNAPQRHGAVHRDPRGAGQQTSRTSRPNSRSANSSA